MNKSFLKSQFKITLPKTYWAFPIEPENTQNKTVTSVVPQERPRRGIALLLAVMVVAVMMVFASDMIISSQVNLSLTYKEQENIKAEYLAKSGIGLGLFALMIDYGMDLFMAKTMKQPQTDGLGDIWNMVNGIPIGGDTAELIGGFTEKMGLNKVNDSSIIDRLKDFEGQFVININDEMQKINLNDCTEGFCTEVRSMLKALFSCPAERAFIELKNLNGAKLVANIKDWVDLDKNVTEGGTGSDEDAIYEKKTPPYKAKNAPFFTLDELKMIDGWDNEMQAVFADYLTIFPFKKNKDDKQDKININTASKGLLACLIPEAGLECGEKFALDFKKRQNDKISFSSADEIKNFISDVMCHRTEAANGTDNPANWFDTKSTTYKIEAVGTVGDQTKTIHMVITRKPPEKENKIRYEDSSAAYRLLYWKMF